MKKILLSIAMLAGIAVSAQETPTNSEIAGNIHVNNGTGFELKFNSYAGLDHTLLNCLSNYDTYSEENATYSVDTLEDGNGFLKVSFEAQETENQWGNHLNFGAHRLPVRNCEFISDIDLVDISANPVIKARVRATTPVSLILTAATLDQDMWITQGIFFNPQEIAGDGEWTNIEFEIEETSFSGPGNLENVIGWEIYIANGSDLAAGEIHFDYVTFGSSDFTVTSPCENENAINDTTVVNYKNHEETPKTIAFTHFDTLITENGCYSLISNFEYYCEEATRRDTNFVVTSDINLANNTQFELSQTIGQNRNGCDSMIYTYTSYIYCSPKETEETIIIKTVNSTIFDDQTDLLSSLTYTTKEGCDSIHSVYRLFKHDPSSSDTIYNITTDTIYESDTVYELGTDTIYDIVTDTVYQTDTIYDIAMDTIYETDTVYELGTDTIYEFAIDTVFIENTTCDTLVIDLSDINNTEYLSSEFHLKVYPNPASELLYLDYKKPEFFTDNLSLTIFDNSGRAVNQQQLTGNSVNSIDLSKMAAGTYFITIYDSSINKVAQAPFVINK